MLVVGINEGFNASVVFLKDGEIIFALQEERLNKKKEYAGFPEQALKFSLSYLGINPSDIDAVCLSNLKSPTRSREELIAGADFRADLPHNPDIFWRIRNKFKNLKAQKKERAAKTPEEYLQDAGLSQVPLHRYNHHFLHAASAYYAMRKNRHEPHLVLTLDGGGDGDCAHIYKVQEDKFDLIAKSSSGNSIGNVYSAMTHFMGMKPHEHEYKLMGLAAYSNPDYCRPVVDQLKKYVYFSNDNDLCFTHGECGKTSFLYNRLPLDFKRVRFDNLAGGVQIFTQEMMLAWVKNAVKKTGIKNVVVAGGVFMNVKANKIISEDPDIDFFDVMPSCGDETLPFGAVWHFYAENNKENSEKISLKTFCLGPKPDFDLDKVKQQHEGKTLQFEKLDDPVMTAADLMAKGEIVARCCGPMEFGARSLGNRSLIADAANQKVIPYINKIIKNRDFWMPFAPAMLKEEAARYIKIPKSLSPRISPFMMHSFDTTDSRDEFIAGVHAYDMTARAQTVDADSNPGFYQVLQEFKNKTGKAVCLNTSFNLHGLPIVMGTEDAVHVMLNSGLKYLIVEDTLITKIAA
ncbi:MAG TPA: carbamoyltransferase C-terminal domain-containing protein [Alphaproteobacteria bacterium]|nr:carbamoyltransferase C-terminal domain-containing protein [Alphaproteobacteria bacterium]